MIERIGTSGKQIKGQEQNSKSKEIIQDSNKQDQFRVSRKGGFNLEDAKIQNREKSSIFPFVSFVCSFKGVSSVSITALSTISKHFIQDRQILFFFSHHKDPRGAFSQKESTQKGRMTNNFQQFSKVFY